MGKGDIKSKRGKIVNGSYGVRRRKKKAGKPASFVGKPTKVKEPVKKEVVKNEVAKEEVIQETPAKETAKKETTKTAAKKKTPKKEED